jgi:hypothetical protein
VTAVAVPSCPARPEPQQKIVPVVARPHECRKPASMLAKVSVPETAVGLVRCVVDPSPT